MNLDEAKQIHGLLYTLMGQLHEKVVIKSREESVFPAWVKKNHGKIINLLYQHESLTLTQIGKCLDIEKGSLTTLVDQMVEQDFVIRSDHPTDRRKSLISLTAQSQLAMDQLIDLGIQKLNGILANADAPKVREFLSSLQYVVDFMKMV